MITEYKVDRVRGNSKDAAGAVDAEVTRERAEVVFSRKNLE